MLTTFTPYSFETAAPESVGIDSAAIAEFEARIRKESCGHQGYMLWRRGKLVASSIASPYRVTDKRHVYSISKSWTSTAIGIAVDEGLLSVEDSVISFFPELLPETVSDNLAAMKVKHVLSMNTGHDTDTLGRVGTAEPEWAKRFLSLAVEHEPGTHFAYNSTATYMLSAILTKLTGMRMLDYIRPRLLNPLGIKDVTWDESPDGVNTGGWGIHVSPEDMLKLGILYLNKGVWNGKRILSEEWVEAASSYQSDNSANGNADWKLGYGYQFWRCQHNCYRGDGAYGQYIIVSPDTGSVMVIISETGDMQKVLDIYWETILASMTDGINPVKGEFDMSAQPFMPLPTGTADAHARQIKLDSNRFGIKAMNIRPCGNGLAVTLTGPEKYSSEIVCGFGAWEYNRLEHNPIAPNQFLSAVQLGAPTEIAASYAMDGGILKLRLVFLSSPHGIMLDIGEKSLSLTATLDRKPTEVGLI
ncbi:MAG: serine hydrolase [Ruminococcaceae bacterium]|nr:serine hydrolase [Oscillospiraceae bacterium]